MTCGTAACASLPSKECQSPTPTAAHSADGTGPQGNEELLGNGGQRKAAGTTYGHGAGPTWIDVAISCSWAIVVRAG